MKRLQNAVLAGLLLLGALPVCAQLATVTVTPSTLGQKIPATFGGISTFNVPDNCDLMGTAAAPNPIYRQLIKNLIFTRQSFVLTSEDDDGGGGIPVAGGPSQTQVGCAGQLFTDMLAANYQYQYFNGVPICTGNQTLANQYATAFLTYMPALWKPQMVVGNEPDGPCGIAYSTYASRFATWTTGIRALTGGINTKFMGPQFGGQQTWNDTSADLNPFVNANATVLAAGGQHWYTQNGCSGSPTVAAELSAGAAKPTDFTLTGGVWNYAANAHAAGTTLRISEMNDIDCSGRAGISDTFTAALWIMDAMANLANAGTDGVNIFSDEGDHYDLFGFTTTSAPYTISFIHPEYYGFMVFQELTQNSANFIPSPITTSSNVTSWATIDANQVVRVLVINKDQSGTGTVNITVPGSGLGYLKKLVAPSVTSTTGITYAGQTFDGSTTGAITGTFAQTVLTPASNVYSFSLAVTQAALLTIPSTSPVALGGPPGWHKVFGSSIGGSGAEGNASMCPTTGTYQGNGPNTPFLGNCQEALDAWSSGISDTKRNRQVFWGGGHTDYGGNEIYILDLSHSPPVMQRANQPTAGTIALGNFEYVGTPNSGNGTCTGVIMTGGTLPNSRHTYDGLVYLPTTDEMLSVGGSLNSCGDFSGEVWTLELSSVAGACVATSSCTPVWTDRGQSVAGGLGNAGYACSYDPVTVLAFCMGNGGFLVSYNPATGVTTKLNTSLNTTGYSEAVVDPVHHYFVLIGTNAARLNGVEYVPINSNGTVGANVKPTPIGTCSAISGAPGVVWDPIDGVIRISDVNYKPGNVVTILDPATWTCTNETYGSVQGTDYPLAGANQCSNSNHQCQINGKFGYLPAIDAFPVCNSGIDDCWYLRVRRGERIQH